MTSTDFKTFAAIFKNMGWKDENAGRKPSDEIIPLNIKSYNYLPR